MADFVTKFTALAKKKIQTIYYITVFGLYVKK